MCMFHRLLRRLFYWNFFFADFIKHLREKDIFCLEFLFHPPTHLGKDWETFNHTAESSRKHI